MTDSTAEQQSAALTSEEDLVQRVSVAEASDSGNVVALEKKGSGEDEVQPDSAQAENTVPDGVRLAEWMKAQVQLPGYVADDDWTPQHTDEFASFCADPDRKHWFLWITCSAESSGQDFQNAPGQESDNMSHKRLAYADQLPADEISQLLKPRVVPEESGATFVFAVKKTLTVVLSRPLAEQLLCLSLHGPVMQQIATIIRGVCIPLLRANPLCPESLKKGLLRRRYDMRGALCSQLSCYAGQLSEVATRTNGCNTLALPIEDLSDTAQCLADRDLMQRLEGFILSWTRRVKEILSLQQPQPLILKRICELACLSGLLRNIACEVIRRGQASIDVDAIWAGDVAAPMESLQHAIQCGLVLKKLFKQISSLIKAEGKAPCTWDFADRAAFAETEAIRGNIKELQKVFAKSLSRLEVMGRSVLQVKETKWHTEYGLFREQSVLCIKRQFDLMKKNRASFLATKQLHPPRSGASLWCRGATTHLQRQLQALREIGLPTDSKDAEHALDLHNDTINALQQHLTALDRKAAPGFQRLTWNSKGIKEFFVRDMWKDCQSVTDYVCRFQNAKKRIRAVIQASANVHLIGVDKKSTLELDHFLLQQEQARSSALSTFKAHYNEIVSQAKALEEVMQTSS
ncbi:hypothetical protein ACSSS7_003649 [Eimeria intestinalis]